MMLSITKHSTLLLLVLTTLAHLTTHHKALASPLYRCSPPSQQNNEIYFPNIEFSINTNVVGSTNNRLYIYTVPIPGANCSDMTVIGAEYCYRLNDIFMNETHNSFELLMLNRNGNTFTVERRFGVSSRPAGAQCRSDASEGTVCCERTPFATENQFQLPSGEFTFGTYVASAFHLVRFRDDISKEVETIKLSPSSGAIDVGDSFTDDGTNVIAGGTLRVMRFIIGPEGTTVSMQMPTVTTGGTTSVAASIQTMTDPATADTTTTTTTEETTNSGGNIIPQAENTTPAPTTTQTTSGGNDPSIQTSTGDTPTQTSTGDTPTQTSTKDTPTQTSTEDTNPIVVLAGIVSGTVVAIVVLVLVTVVVIAVVVVASSKKNNKKRAREFHARTMTAESNYTLRPLNPGRGTLDSQHSDYYVMDPQYDVIDPDLTIRAQKNQAYGTTGIKINVNKKSVGRERLSEYTINHEASMQLPEQFLNSNGLAYV